MRVKRSPKFEKLLAHAKKAIANYHKAERALLPEAKKLLKSNESDYLIALGEELQVVTFKARVFFEKAFMLDEKERNKAKKTKALSRNMKLSHS